MNAPQDVLVLNVYSVPAVPKTNATKPNDAHVADVYSDVRARIKINVNLHVVDAVDV